MSLAFFAFASGIRCGWARARHVMSDVMPFFVNLYSPRWDSWYWYNRMCNYSQIFLFFLFPLRIKIFEILGIVFNFYYLIYVFVCMCFKLKMLFKIIDQIN